MAQSKQRDKREPDRKRERADRKKELVGRKQGRAVRTMVELARKMGRADRKLEPAVRKLGERKPEELVRTREPVVRKQEPWRKPVQKKLLRKRGQVQVHTEPVVGRKPEQEQHRNTAEEECKEQVRLRKQEQQAHRTTVVGERKLKLTAQFRTAGVAGKPVLEPHRKIVVVVRKQTPKEQSRTTAAGVAGKPERGLRRKRVLGERHRKLEPEQLRKVAAEDKPERLRTVAVGDRPVLERLRMREEPRRKSVVVGESKEPELMQRKPILHHKLGLVVRTMTDIAGPEPGRNLPQAGGQRE